MTDETMALRGLLEKSADASFLQEMIGFAAQRLMDLEVGGITGAAHGERSPDHLVQRNGYRERDWQTRAGTVELRIPSSGAAATSWPSLSPGAWPGRHSPPRSRRPTSRASPRAPWTTWCGPWGWRASPRAKFPGSAPRSTRRVRDFLARPIEGDWPYLWLDATYVKMREAGRIVPVAVAIAVGVHANGRREVLGMAVGSSEAEPFWLDFLRTLARRGLRGAKP